MPADTTEHAHGNDYSDLPDPVLAPLSRRQADLLIHLALATATELGHSLTYRDDGALAPADHRDDSPVLGLSNIARVVAHFDESNWPVVVEEHFRHILRQLRAGVPPLPADPERDLVQRLVCRDSLPTGWVSDRPDFLPGLVSVASTEDDGVVTMYLRPTDLGLTWSEAERYGLANLRRLKDQVEFVDDDDLRFAVVTSNGYAASRALVLDTVLHDTLHLETAPYGMLAAVPARDTLLLHVIEDLTVIPALGVLLNLAARSYARDPGPLSPEIYLVTPEQTWHPATSLLPDHTPLRLSPELDALTQQLATREIIH
jgi:hypothetical protein